MSTEIAPDAQHQPGLPWPALHARRGSGMVTPDITAVDATNRFSKRFPIGTMYENSEFDEFAFSEGLLPRPQTNDKSSPEWVKHGQSRTRLRNQIASVSTTNRVRTPFVIVKIERGVYKVVDPKESVIKDPTAKKLVRAVKRGKRNMEHNLQAIHVDTESPEVRAVLSIAYSVLQGSEDLAQLQARNHDQFSANVTRVLEDLSRIKQATATKALETKGLLNPEDLYHCL